MSTEEIATILRKKPHWSDCQTLHNHIGFFLKFVASSTADIYNKQIINAALYTCQFVLIKPCDQHKKTFCFIEKVEFRVKTNQVE